MKNDDDDKIIDITSHPSRRKHEIVNYNMKGFQIKQVNQNIFNNLMMQVILVNQIIIYVILYYLATR